MFIKQPLVNISNLLTLRYDPTSVSTNEIRNITYKEISNWRREQQQHANGIPSDKDIENAIRRLIRMRIEEYQVNRITVALSSGIDSNVILSLIRKEFPAINIECLTVRFDDDGSVESIDAREIAENQNAGFHEIHVDNPLRDLPLLLSIIKEPRWNVYQYYFIEKAKTISNTLFTGDGGDELFAGYIFRYKKFLESIKSNYSWLDRVQTYLQCHERDWVPDQEAMFGEKIEFNWPSIYLKLKEYFDNELDPLEQVLLADYHGKLMYDFIPTNEKYFKHFNINGIAPLLSNEIIDLSIRIPASLKYDFTHNIGKIQLHEIIKRNISSYSVENKKMGFGMDLVKFWFRIGKEIVTSNLEKGRIFEDKIINREWYAKSLPKISQSKDPRYISKMLQLLSLEIWYKLFITHEINSTSSL
ncbi:MAG TPA: asparagine synthase C-terminal domain-containing protein [Nitrososphaeraceae archaeon]|nr:asparagine synthase C-terminal domain-containing protein [Nitrososphaeraceae archaeon]